MITSLLKTFLLSLPMSMGGLCNSGNSYVHNAYDRRNVATAQNYAYDDYVEINDNSNYVLNFSRIPSLVGRNPNTTLLNSVGGIRSISLKFDFYSGLDDEQNYTLYRGIVIDSEIINMKQYVYMYYMNMWDTDTFNSQNGTLVWSYELYDSDLDITNPYDLLRNNSWNFIHVNYANKSSVHFNGFESDFNVFGLFFSKPTVFTFDEFINYNAFVGQNLTYPFFDPSISSLFYPMDIDNHSYYFGATSSTMVLFMSNGILFNQIKYYMPSVYQHRFFTRDDYDEFDTNVVFNTQEKAGDWCYFSHLEYAYMATGNESNPNFRHDQIYTVNKRASVSAYGYDYTGGYSMELEAICLYSSWSLDSWRTIELLYEFDFNDQFMRDCVSMNNKDYIDNYVATGGGYSTGGNVAGLGNSFNLIKSGFGGFVSILNIQIIPGLSVGLLLFLPMIMSIVVLVFKAVKK